MLPLHYKAEKSGEATEGTKDNKEICGDKERREQLAWVDGAVRVESIRLYRRDPSKSISVEQREEIGKRLP